MALNKDDYQKEKSFSKQKKGSRLGIAALFLGTILLSTLLWAQKSFKGWWQDLFKPASYEIVKQGEKSLVEVIGFQPDLADLDGVRKSIELLLSKLSGTYGVYFYNLETNESFGINQDQVYTAASINKIPIMVSFYQSVEDKKFKEEDEYSLKRNDVQDYGTGQLRYQKIGTKYTYAKLIELTGKISDNTAAYVLENLVKRKTIQSKLDELKLDNTSMEGNTTTPKEIGQYLLLLYNDQLVSKENKEKILNALTDTDFEDRIPQGVPKEAKVAHKIGNEIQVYSDCGIIRASQPYILCILTKEVKEAEALEVIPKISRLVWEFLSR